MPFSLYKSSL